MDYSTQVSQPALLQNWPNPFDAATAITYTLPEGGSRICLLIYDSTGKLVRRLPEGVKPFGTHTAAWDGRDNNGRDAESGVYFCCLEIDGNGFSDAKKIILRR